MNGILSGRRPLQQLRNALNLTCQASRNRRRWCDRRQLFSELDDVSIAAKRVVELGGKVIVPPQKLPDGDEMAILQDPAGITFGLKRTTGE